MRRPLLAMIIALTTACYDQEPNSGATVNGAYTLRTVNNSALPYTTSGSGANKTELLDDTFTLYAGFTFTESGHVRTTASGTSTVTPFTSAGSFILQGTSITFQPAGTSAVRIAIGSNNATTMTITESGMTYVYNK